MALFRCTGGQKVSTYKLAARAGNARGNVGILLSKEQLAGFSKFKVVKDTLSTDNILNNHLLYVADNPSTQGGTVADINTEIPIPSVVDYLNIGVQGATDPITTGQFVVDVILIP